MHSHRKASRKSLHFDDLQTPSRVRQQETTLSRKPAHMSEKCGFKRKHNAAGSCWPCFRKISSSTAGLIGSLLQAIIPRMLSAGDWFGSIARITGRRCICTTLLMISTSEPQSLCTRVDCAWTRILLASSRTPTFGASYVRTRRLVSGDARCGLLAVDVRASTLQRKGNF